MRRGASVLRAATSSRVGRSPATLGDAPREVPQGVTHVAVHTTPSATPCGTPSGTPSGTPRAGKEALREPEPPREAAAMEAMLHEMAALHSEIDVLETRTGGVSL